MKLFKPLPILLVSILLAACGPMEQMAEMASAEITAESSAEDKVASALSAAPDIVSEGAMVLDWPAADTDDARRPDSGDFRVEYGPFARSCPVRRRSITVLNRSARCNRDAKRVGLRCGATLPTQTHNSGRAEQWIAGCGWVALFPSLNWLSIRHHLIEHCVHWTEFCKWTRYLKYSYSNSYIDPTEANPIGKKYGA